MLESALKECLVSEEQAIAIYAMESRILKLTAFNRARRDTLALCQTVLVEERAHRLDIGAHVVPGPLFRLQLGLARLGGYIVGAILACLPTRLNWKIHVWAERQAASIYAQAKNRVPIQGQNESLLQSLKKAYEQELAHAELFQNRIALTN